MGPELMLPLIMGAGIGASASAMMNKDTPATPDITLPQQAAPASQPNAKPQRGSMQQSFMSAAASSGLPGQGASVPQKTLLGQ